VDLAIGERVVKCDCGHEFCDYRENWKLQAKIFVRDTEEKMNEIYPKLMSPDPEWQVIREYYCPSCATQLEVEAVPPWYPIILDFEPDIDTFYNEWIKKPLPAVK
jgi:acetone carboxylase, gamma subunit